MVLLLLLVVVLLLLLGRERVMLTRPADIVAYYDEFVQERMRMAAAAHSTDIQQLLSESDMLWRLANQSVLANVLSHVKRAIIDAADSAGLSLFADLQCPARLSAHPHCQFSAVLHVRR